MRTILAPGVQIREIDKSQYSPAMTGTNCFVMGFTDRGEPYTPMEFTSRAAWTSYYGTPDNEAERYAYAAVCEVLNAGGRLYFSRLPYDNAAFEKVAGFKYELNSSKTISCEIDETTGLPVDYGTDVQKCTPFWEIVNADSTISNACAIVPKDVATLYDLSAIDEYRTDEAKVANNTFLIVDTAFNTYGKIPEDVRKNEKREMIGIMPVITTAANAMLAQSLINVKKENVIGYETIGTIRTLDAASQLAETDQKLSSLVSNTVLTSDCARILNTKYWYQYVTSINIRTTDSVSVLTSDIGCDDIISSRIVDHILSNRGKPSSWDGRWQIETRPNPEVSSETLSSANFSFLKGFTYDELSTEISCHPEKAGELAPFLDRLGDWHNPDGDDNVPETVSLEANSFFPTIDFDGEHFDRTNLKKIGVVVYKMFLDPAEGNKINFEPVESFAGSLCKTDKDPNTGVTTFIDTIINSQSQYINFFSNCFNTAADKKYYNENLDIFVVRPGPGGHPEKWEGDLIEYMNDFKTAIDTLAKYAQISFETTTVESINKNIQALERILEDNQTPVDSKTVQEMKERLESIAKNVLFDKIPDATCPSLGFYSEMTREDISITKSLYDGMNKCFDKMSDINERDIDIVPDAGLANIASYLKAIYGDKGPYDLQVTDDVGNSLLGMWKCNANNSAVKTWKTVEQKLDNFCKNIRKDCMFIADGPRPLVLAGQKKIIRPSKPANTIDSEIIPNIKWVTGLNTSYGAMYVDWFEQADDYSGDFFWCPPSIKAMGVYINTDVNFNYWDAPAGLNRGVIAATDVAFSPTVKQAGSFYEKNLNYAINYPQDGIVLEGQKTLQTKPSAFDRVNVRRLFLRLERMTFKVARYFVYEGNTAYTRQRLVDAIDPYFREVKNKGGIFDYKIICDDSTNPPEVIDRNELCLKVGLKPTRTAEFLMIDFIALSTGGSFEEAMA